MSRETRAPEDFLAVALDVPTLEEARRLADDVSPHVKVVKVGLELFCRFGPEAVRAVAKPGRRIFLDLKLHDIPETVGRAIESLSALGVDLLTLHAGGGAPMMRRAAAAAPPSLQLLAVTVLTSLDRGDLEELNVALAPEAHAAALATLASRAGVSGFVCAPTEVATLRASVPSAFIVTPGIRPVGGDAGDQKRVATPGDAIRAGADLLVVGRPLRDASDRPAAARALREEVSRALGEMA